MNKKTKSVILRPEVHKAVKSYCTKHGTKMSWVVEKVLTEFLNKYFEEEDNEKNKVYMFLDDDRKPADIYPEAKHKWVVVKSYTDFVEYVDKHGVPDFISFDHDLGSLGTGYNCAKYIVDKELPIKEFTSHSANPVGRENIIKLLTNYSKFLKGGKK